MIPAKGIPASGVAPHSKQSSAPINEVLEAVAAVKKPKAKKVIE